MIDYSTLNAEALSRLPVYKKPPTYTIDNHLGSACYGDPPGFPSYFLQHIYTQHGNSPPYNRPQQVIVLGGVARVVPDIDWSGGTNSGWAKRDEFLRSLWTPLPYDHPRVRRWIIETFRHFYTSYYDPEETTTGGHTASWPVPDWQKRKTKIDERWRDDVIAAYEAADAAFNAALEDRVHALATPNNHMAHREIVRFYPEHSLSMTEALIAEVPNLGGQADWWHIEAEQPSVEECLQRAPWIDWAARHPEEPGRHCSRCGRTNPT